VAERVRREVLALKELGDRHGQFLNATLRQLGMGESIRCWDAGRMRKRPTVAPLAS
jgi:hypothetical protein